MRERDQDSAGMNEISGRVSGQLGHFSKTDVRFWQDRLFRETYRNKGRLCRTTHWSARIQHEGRRERFPLYTPNKAAAAARARDIYLFLVANGWEAALARYRKSKGIAQERNDKLPVTVGEFLDAVFSVCTNRSTIEGYATAFRKIVADLSVSRVIWQNSIIALVVETNGWRRSMVPSFTRSRRRRSRNGSNRFLQRAGMPHSLYARREFP